MDGKNYSSDLGLGSSEYGFYLNLEPNTESQKFVKHIVLVVRQRDQQQRRRGRRRWSDSYAGEQRSTR